MIEAHVNFFLNFCV